MLVENTILIYKHIFAFVEQFSLSQPYLPDSMSSQHPGETFNSIRFILLDPAIGGASPGSGVATPAL
ncbi:MAG: hypothetical protein KKA10_16775 [Euryarchaeota archaeon]|nr:hypothetical protein [Euryarchaeota archaeon]MCG2735389.1 hypothetical protein [Candidatus Methanoperedenaceae archaeon]